MTFKFLDSSLLAMYHANIFIKRIYDMMMKSFQIWDVKEADGDKKKTFRGVKGHPLFCFTHLWHVMKM